MDKKQHGAAPAYNEGIIVQSPAFSDTILALYLAKCTHVIATTPDNFNTLAASPSHRYFEAALIALFFVLPFCFGSLGLLAFYNGFIALFVIVIHVYLRKRSPSACRLIKQYHPIAFYLLMAWIISSSLSMLMVLLSTSAAPENKAASLIRHLYDLLILAFCINTAKLSLINQLNISRVFFALIAGVITMCLFHIGVYLSMDWSGNDRFWFSTPPLGPHVRDQGNLACVAFISASIALIHPATKNLLLRCALATSLIFSFGFVIWSGGRMAVIASLLSLLIISVLCLAFGTEHQTRLSSLKKIALILVVTGGGFFAGEALSVFNWNGFERTAKATQAASQSVSQSGVSPQEKFAQLSTGRTKIWSLSISAFKEKPWLGLGAFGYFFIPERSYDDQPHNFIIQFLVEWGIVGTSLMGLLLCLCLYQVASRRHLLLHPLALDQTIAYGVVLALTLHGLTGGTYFKIQPFTCLALGYSAFIFTLLRQAQSSTHS